MARKSGREEPENFFFSPRLAKVYRNLFPELIRFANLWEAYRQAATGKRGTPAVAAFERDLEANLLRLQRELADHGYRPGGYYSFHIRDPKHRLVSAAPFRDRVVHHALCNLIEPIFERTFIGDSYANRIGKGTHRALDRAQHFSRRYPFVLQCDVREFFPSIDHACLRVILARKIADPDVLWLIDAILDNGADVLREQYRMVYFPGDDLFAAGRPRGLPIGNLTSQFWANVYLNELDQLVKRTLRWLIPATVKLPREHRFVLAEMIQRTAFRFQEEILEAGHRPRPVAELARADVTLAQLKLYLRLCHDLDLFSHGQYEHVARMVVEVGRLLGAWRKSLQARRPPTS